MAGPALEIGGRFDGLSVLFWRARLMLKKYLDQPVLSATQVTAILVRGFP